MSIEWRGRKVVDLEVDGIEMSDYPKFCDAFISRATWNDTGQELTDEELEDLTSEDSDLVYKLVENHLN
jgi:hypothetical protein